MAMTEFAMVEELASLIKDNLFCKHLILSTEEALVKFLQDDASPEGILELQPMSPYHRLLVHRLADIYGFAHESAGEGDDRHLVLERCPDTTIPSILVSDILWQYDGYESSASPQPILMRQEIPGIPGMKNCKALPSSSSLEEREAAYLAARERIFSLHETDVQDVAVPKSRIVPVVARRMIAHALGQKISSESLNQKPTIQKYEQSQMDEFVNNERKSDNHVSSTPEVSKKIIFSTMKSSSYEKKAYDKTAGKITRYDSVSSGERNSNNRITNIISSSGNLLVNGSKERVTGIENLEKEQIGAAKRIFAHALGLTSSKQNQGSHVKINGGNRPSSQDV